MGTAFAYQPGNDLPRSNRMSEKPAATQDRVAPAPRTVEERLAAAERCIQECEAALEEAEARFRNIIDRNADAIVVVGADGLIQYANAKAERIFGSPRSVLTGTPFGLPLTVGATTELDVVVGDAPRVVEMCVTDSTWDGRPVRLAQLHDVTVLDRLRRERAMQAATQAAEARLREIISQAPVAIAVLRGAEHRYEITNELYQELIGHRGVVGLPIREALPELRGQGIYELLDQVYATGEPYVGKEIALMIERRSGGIEETIFTFVYQPLRESDGAIFGIAIVASDVTSQVQARKAVEAANKAKSDFLATMSHELRTPLNAIGGYTDLLLEGIRGPILPAQRLDLERINRSQRHLLSVINDILNFAKVEAGRLRLNLADISMNEALGNLESLVAPMLLEKKITYEYRCCDPAYRAHADPERLQQILLNLLSNAAKFTPPGGSIVVECTALPKWMRVQVMDTGFGIPEDKLQTIFEPFVQLERSQSRDTGGTGLGLAISRDLARVMGGELRAKSEVGKGSRFILTLPRVAGDS
jgi:signal transduction histidine kinase